MKTKMSGSVRDIVNYTARTDARETVVDAKTGAEIRINIDGLDEATEQDEPFYIEYGENLYDAYNRKEAAMILSNIRRGERFPDQPRPKPAQKPATKRKSTKRFSIGGSGMQGLRR